MRAVDIVNTCVCGKIILNTYSCHVDAGDKVRVALDLRPVQAVEHLADVCCQGREDLGRAASHTHEADG